MDKLSLPVLVLNANYEPLNVCSTRRAVTLYLSGKAEMLQNGRGVIKTVNRSIPQPSIIRLGYMIKRPRPTVRLTKKEVFRRDHYSCQYCGARTHSLTLDHVNPRSRGGEHTWTNLVTACPECNVKKGGRSLQEARMNLRQPPREPHPTAIYLYGGFLRENEDWRPYLEGW